MYKIIRFILIAIATALMILFLIPALFLKIFNAGNIMGIFFSGIILTLGFNLKRILNFLSKLCAKKAGKILTVLLALSAASLLGFVVFSSFLITQRFYNPPTESTTAIVLGCKVNPDGPSAMLASRIDAAYAFLKENPDVKCIATGGMGSDEQVSEARCIYNELIAKGIDKDRIYIEDKATNTKENILLSREIIRKEKLPRKITIITSEFHQYRASAIASELGMESFNLSGKTQFILFPSYFLREIGGVLYELIF